MAAQEGSRSARADFVPPAERIASFDNDGTLWPERPASMQLLFALDPVRQLALQHPEWRSQEPFASLLRGDLKGAMAGGERSVAAIVMATHTGMTTEAFEQLVNDWIRSARHPATGRLYTEMAYQPMLELLAHLRANGFRTFLVSGGGVEFLRPWVERVYGIPPEQLLGLHSEALQDGRPVLVRLPALDFVNDRGGKPVGIQRHIGRRPIAAFGNSDGDVAMLQRTTAGPGPRLGVLVHRTDAEREWAYDRGAPMGALDCGLDEARERGWTVVDIKRDWRVIDAPLPPAGPPRP